MRQANLRRRHPQVKRADVLGNGAAVKMKTTSASGASTTHSLALVFLLWVFFPFFSQLCSSHKSIHSPTVDERWRRKKDVAARVEFTEPRLF